MKDVKVLLRDTRYREKIFKPVVEYRGYIDTLKDFGLTILELTDKDIVAALQIANGYGLLIADAAHLAVMKRKGIGHMVSSDSDFKRVDDITLWSLE